MATMLLGGLWHGAAWTFVIWGGIHGVGLTVERWWRERSPERARTPSAWRIWLQRLLTFNLVCLAWIFFRSDSLDLAWQMLSGLFTRWGQPSPLVTAGVVFWIVVGIGTQYLPKRVPRGIMARLARTAACRSVGRPRRCDHARECHGPSGRLTLHLLPLLMRIRVALGVQGAAAP